MELELKHIAPYLPYGLKYKVGSVKNGTYELIDLGFFHIQLISDIENEEVLTRNIDDESIKPILRPLSDLTKEIRHKDVNFIPVEFLTKEGFNIYVEWIESGFTDIIHSNYKFIQLLLEWHFDVFGLIEQGLAIDINTLTE